MYENTKLQTIRQVSQSYGISRQMLGYYEKIGLIKSIRKDDYAYRVYDVAAISRLRQIIILRKLRIPVKQIRKIFDNVDAASLIEVFEYNISKLNEEITSLSTVKSILDKLVCELREKANVLLQLDFLSESDAFAIVDSISLPNNILQEEMKMSDLNKADDSLSKFKDGDVRIVYLPPMTVAASYASGEFEWGVGPEATSKIEQFVYDTGLLKMKPDARGLGFDCSREDRRVEIDIPATAYEAWVSIPDDMEVRAPLTKKTFDGGMYAAHVLRDWNFKRDWNMLIKWVEESEKYECTNGPYFEEVLNYYHLMQNDAKMEDTQLDLLLPIKFRS